ncbi:nucleotidyltransferase family protein [Bacillus sp. FJAT-42315]|uniref:nucleotidyltransferase family protein n=1 Tax=Bacillus sp. FJAT-42315 TaxID=2014077 RepID=UPI000C244624|nr:nucleotidyltransferase family protein [Bacillus sp. FJAT-42315]
MKGVILAGGRGERLKPLTDWSPKPMVPLLNKPLLEYNLELFKKQGITDLTLTVCYKKESIKQHIGDGSRFGVNVTYIEEKDPLGTAGSLFQHADRFKETFVVLSGDALTNISLEEAIRFHRSKQALLTLVAVEVERPEEFGICLTNEEGRLLSFLEKPEKEQVFSHVVNTGIYIIEPEVLERYHFSGKVDFAKDLFPVILKDCERVFVYRSEAYWQDIGNVYQHWLAEKRLKSGISGIVSTPTPSVAQITHYSTQFLKRFHFRNTLSASWTNKNNRQWAIKTREQ